MGARVPVLACRISRPGICWHFPSLFFRVCCMSPVQQASGEAVTPRVLGPNSFIDTNTRMHSWCKRCSSNHSFACYWRRRCSVLFCMHRKWSLSLLVRSGASWTPSYSWVRVQPSFWHATCESARLVISSCSVCVRLPECVSLPSPLLLREEGARGRGENRVAMVSLLQIVASLPWPTGAIGREERSRGRPEHRSILYSAFCCVRREGMDRWEENFERPDETRLCLLWAADSAPPASCIQFLPVPRWHQLPLLRSPSSSSSLFRQEHMKGGWCDLKEVSTANINSSSDASDELRILFPWLSFLVPVSLLSFPFWGLTILFSLFSLLISFFLLCDFTPSQSPSVKVYHRIIRIRLPHTHRLFELTGCHIRCPFVISSEN